MSPSENSLKIHWYRWTATDGIRIYGRRLDTMLRRDRQTDTGRQQRPRIGRVNDAMPSRSVMSRRVQIWCYPASCPAAWYSASRRRRYVVVDSVSIRIVELSISDGHNRKLNNSGIELQISDEPLSCECPCSILIIPLLQQLRHTHMRTFRFPTAVR